MKKFNFLYLFAFAAVGCFMSSCGDDDAENNTITITIEEPIDGENIAFASCGDIHVHVDFAASDENHEVEVVLHPEGNVDDKILDIDMHEHDKEITIEQEVDLCSYGAGACFHLEVKACVDHDCEKTETAEVEFCLE